MDHSDAPRTRNSTNFWWKPLGVPTLDLYGGTFNPRTHCFMMFIAVASFSSTTYSLTPVASFSSVKLAFEFLLALSGPLCVFMLHCRSIKPGEMGNNHHSSFHSANVTVSQQWLYITTTQVTNKQIQELSFKEEVLSTSNANASFPILCHCFFFYTLPVLSTHLLILHSYLHV